MDEAQAATLRDILSDRLPTNLRFDRVRDLVEVLGGVVEKDHERNFWLIAIRKDGKTTRVLTTECTHFIAEGDFIRKLRLALITLDIELAA